MLDFTFEGRLITAQRGQTVSAALLSAGVLDHRTASDGTKRGAFCGIGACQECLLSIDGGMPQRGCLTEVAPGMNVRRALALPVDENAPGVSSQEPQRSEAMRPDNHGMSDEAPLEEIGCDILIVGAGPAGLVVARELARGGRDVLLVDERHLPGGQYFKQNAVAAAQGDAQAKRGSMLIEEMVHSGARYLGDTMVWSAARETDGLVLGAIKAGQAFYIRPSHLVIATGAQEAPRARPGWTLPGVMTTGAMQTFGRGYEVRPKGPLVIAGNGPLNLQLAAEYLAHGETQISVVEAAPPPWRRLRQMVLAFIWSPRLALTGARHLLALRRAGVAILWASAASAFDGKGSLQRVCIRGKDGSEKWVEARLCALGDGFLPASELARLLGCRTRISTRFGTHPETGRRHDGRTEQEDISIIGEAGSFGGATLAQAQGVLCADRLLTPHQGSSIRDIASRLVRRSLARLRYAVAARFQSTLWKLYEPDIVLSRSTGHTIVCRCECVTAKTVIERIERDHLSDLAAIKRATRAGMGRCQGRFCQATLMQFLPQPEDVQAFTAPQIPLRPVPIGALARQKPEWRGHRRVETQRGRPSPRPIDKTRHRVADVAVIGGGLVGLFAARALAQAGQKVVVLEKSRLGALASGGNAGSLHAQLMAFDPAEEGGGVSLQARTLDLQRRSIALWQALRPEFDRDIELSVCGGLVIAETDADMARLRRKVAIEQQLGIACSMVDAQQLRVIEPKLREGFQGGAYCLEEGKINPLAATLALARLLRERDVTIEEGQRVRGLKQVSNGFEIDMDNEGWSVGAVINAAGAYAGDIAGMLGQSLPVYGAPLQMIVTEPVAPVVSSLLAHASRHLTLKQAKNGSLLIGGGWSAGIDPIHGHPRPSRASLEGNLWVALRLLPALSGVRVVRSWGAMNIDIDGAPIIGVQCDRPGFCSAVTANGVTLAPLMGQAACDLVLGKDTGLDLTPFSPDRFRSNIS
ncbi:ferredoxin [Asaia sp. W19]|uniref:FAD-dependent oxidoreductase n=1 Tax=unclassified Asaia TaxID=2685023 RepID=UPI000F8D5574|nr:FAD-dependent oxidoreductase [Asaia sp. W19]RUT24840.1 ferredoxin [Asaia sp. W19]